MNTRGCLDDNEPNPVDIHVGRRLRLRRMLLHITQQELANKLGLTFQQIQKYEKAQNRIGASRLWDIACVLNVPISSFFQDMEDEVKLQSPRMLNAEEAYPLEPEEKKIDPMETTEALMLVQAYNRIPNRKIARDLFNLMMKLSKSSANLYCPEDEEKKLDYSALLDEDE